MNKESSYIFNNQPEIAIMTVLIITNMFILFSIELILKQVGNMFGDKFSKFLITCS